MSETSGGTSVGAVVQALKLLRHLAAQGRPAGVTAIARDTGLNPSTCFNILRTLAAEGIVAFDPAAKSYRLGYGLLELSLGLLGANAAELIRPELQRLGEGRDLLLALWQVTAGDRLVLVERVASTQAVRIDMQVGIRLPATAGAVGRAVAAARGLDSAALRQAFARLQWQAAPSFADWQAQVEQARRLGYALDCGQLFRGVDAAAAVIVDREGRPRLGLSGIAIAGLLPRRTLQGIGRELAALAQRLGAALFGSHSG